MKLEEVVPWGRTLAEYAAFFALPPALLRGRLLDCGGGPSSFNAEATRAGARVVSVDPVYQFSGPQIQSRFEAVSPGILRQVRETHDVWRWDLYGDPEGLLRHRRLALDGFLEDYDAGREAGRYLPVSLPVLPFPADSFDVALSAHLLFLYADHLSLDFHLASLREMLRVAPEVRCFPLLALDGTPSRHVAPVREALGREGHAVRVEAVPFEFRKGGTEMLRVVRRGATG